MWAALPKIYILNPELSWHGVYCKCITLFMMTVFKILFNILLDSCITWCIQLHYFRITFYISLLFLIHSLFLSFCDVYYTWFLVWKVFMQPVFFVFFLYPIPSSALYPYMYWCTTAYACIPTCLLYFAVSLCIWWLMLLSFFQNLKFLMLCAKNWNFASFTQILYAITS